MGSVWQIDADAWKSNVPVVIEIALGVKERRERPKAGKMTDGKGRGGKRENKSRGTRSGADEPKNVRKPERVVGWRTLVALPSRFEFSATRLGFDGGVP
jgi:hypothetical protein